MRGFPVGTVRMWQGGAYRKLEDGPDGKARWAPVPPGQAVDHTHVDGSPKRGTPEAAARKREKAPERDEYYDFEQELEERAQRAEHPEDYEGVPPAYGHKVDPTVTKPGKGGKKYAEREAAGQGSLFGVPEPKNESHSPGDKKLADLISQQQAEERATSKPELPKVEPAGDQGKVAAEISRQQEGDKVGKMPRAGSLASLRGSSKSSGDTPTVRGFEATQTGLTQRDLASLRNELRAEGFKQVEARSTGGLEDWTKGKVGEGEYDLTAEHVSIHPGDPRGAFGPRATYFRTERKPDWYKHTTKQKPIKDEQKREDLRDKLKVAGDLVERQQAGTAALNEGKWRDAKTPSGQTIGQWDPAEVVSMREKAQALTGNRKQKAEELLDTYRKNLTYIATQQQNLKDVADRIREAERQGGDPSYEKQNRRRHLDQLDRYQKHNENIKNELDGLHEGAKRVKAAEEIPDLVAKLDQFLYPTPEHHGLGRGARGDLPADAHKQLMSWYQDASSFDKMSPKRQSELVDEFPKVKARMQEHAATKPGATASGPDPNPWKSGAKVSEAPKPDRADLWGKTARKLLDANKGMTQDDLHYRAYHRAVLGGQEDQAAHLARTYEGARKARQDLIDAAGTSKSLIVVGESRSPRHLLVKSASIQEGKVGPPLILMPSEKDPSVRRWTKPNPGESREQFVARYREKRNMEKRHHLAISQQLAGQTDLVSGRVVTAEQIAASKKRLAEIKDEESREAEREQRQKDRRDTARAGVQHDLFRPAPMKQGEMPFDAPPPSDKPAPPVKPTVPDKGQGDLFGANAYRARQGQGSLGLF